MSQPDSLKDKLRTGSTFILLTQHEGWSEFITAFNTLKIEYQSIKKAQEVGLNEALEGLNALERVEAIWTEAIDDAKTTQRQLNDTPDDY